MENSYKFSHLHCHWTDVQYRFHAAVMLFSFLKKWCDKISEPISSGIHLQNLQVCINDHRKLKSINVEWHLIACDVQFNNPAATWCIAMNDWTANNEQVWRWRWMQSVLRYYPDRCQKGMLKPLNILVIISIIIYCVCWLNFTVQTSSTQVRCISPPVNLHFSGTNSFMFTEEAVTGWKVIHVADIPSS